MNLICDYTHDPHMLINMISICGSCVSSHENYIQQFTYDSRTNQGTYDNHMWHIC